jgi:hypothetical protein
MAGCSTALAYSKRPRSVRVYALDWITHLLRCARLNYDFSLPYRRDCLLRYSRPYNVRQVTCAPLSLDSSLKLSSICCWPRRSGMIPPLLIWAISWSVGLRAVSRLTCWDAPPLRRWGASTALLSSHGVCEGTQAAAYLPGMKCCQRTALGRRPSTSSVSLLTTANRPILAPPILLRQAFGLAWNWEHYLQVKTRAPYHVLSHKYSL